MKPWMKLLITVAAALSLVLSGCDKSDPTAPEMSTVTVTANPSSLTLTGAQTGTSALTATVLDKDNRPVSGLNVHFSTTSGTLRSDGGSVRTDSNGNARDVLTLRGTDDDATVKARASGADEGTVTVNVVVPGVNNPPTAVATISPNPARLNQVVTFNGGGSTDPQGSSTIVNWRWSLTSDIDGDGSSIEIVTGDRTAASVIMRSYPSTRTVIVVLQVTDAEGAVSTPLVVSPTLRVDANPNAPNADINQTSFSTPANVLITLSGSNSSDTEGTIVRYDWDWGDGTAPDNNKTTPSITHTYTTATGSPFTVTLTVYDGGDGTGCDPTTHICNNQKTDTDTILITVTP